MISRQRHPRAFVTPMALVLLALVGVALSLLASAAGSEARRTRDARAGAQLRQLILAGTDAARDSLDAGHSGDAPVKVVLPVELRDANVDAHLEIQASEIKPNQVTFHVQVKVGHHQASQVIRFDRAADGWILSSAELED